MNSIYLAYDNDLTVHLSLWALITYQFQKDSSAPTLISDRILKRMQVCGRMPRLYQLHFNYLGSFQSRSTSHLPFQEVKLNPLVYSNLAGCYRMKIIRPPNETN